MNYNPEIHKRRSIRLRDYNYSKAGAYFVTICSWNRECLFGDIEDGKMQVNEYGQVVEKEWLQTDVVRENVDLDIYVIMPNHFHGIIVLNGNVGATRRDSRFPEIRCDAQERAIHRIALTKVHTKDILGTGSGSIGAIIGQFKTIATKRINAIRKKVRFAGQTL